MFSCKQLSRVKDALLELARYGHEQIDIISCLDNMEKAIGDTQYQDFFAEIREAVTTGQHIGAAIIGSKNKSAFPSFVAPMIQRGEDAGDLNQMAIKMAHACGGMATWDPKMPLILSEEILTEYLRVTLCTRGIESGHAALALASQIAHEYVYGESVTPKPVAQAHFNPAAAMDILNMNQKP